jgi:hypothetical protein
MRMRRVTYVAALALLSCSDPLGPLTDGTPYALRAVNGDSLPWSSTPGGTPTSRIASGHVRIIDDARAERFERTELLDSTGTVVGAGEWGRTGSYKLGFGMLIITYDAWPFGTPPNRPVDTFFVSGKGLLLRETGFIAPLDSMVRYYAP